jgi:hypothetical protein
LANLIGKQYSLALFGPQDNKNAPKHVIFHHCDSSFSLSYCSNSRGYDEFVLLDLFLWSRGTRTESQVDSLCHRELRKRRRQTFITFSISPLMKFGPVFAAIRLSCSLFLCTASVLDRGKIISRNRGYFLICLFTTVIQRNKETMANHMKSSGTLDTGIKMREHLCFCCCKFYPTIQCHCSAYDVPLDAGSWLKKPEKNPTSPKHAHLRLFT